MREVVKSFDLRRFISLGGPSKPLERLAKPRNKSTLRLGEEEKMGPQEGPESGDKSLHGFVNPGLSEPVEKGSDSRIRDKSREPMIQNFQTLSRLD